MYLVRAMSSPADAAVAAAAGQGHGREEESNRKWFTLIMKTIAEAEAKSPITRAKLVDKLLSVLAPNAIEDSKLVNSAIENISILLQAEDAVRPKPLTALLAVDVIRSALFSHAESPSLSNAQGRFNSMSKRQFYKAQHSDIALLVTDEGKTATYRPGNVDATHLAEVWKWFEIHSHESPAKRDEVVLAPDCLLWYVCACQVCLQ